MIRPATRADIGALLMLAEAMHAESRFARRRFSLDKMAALFGSLIDSPDGLVLVAERGGEITGAFAGYIAEDWFGPDRMAGEFGLFVRPDRRGGIDGLRMLEDYRAWAQSRGVDRPEAGISTGVSLDASTRLYQLAGFQPVGTIFEYRETEHVHGR